MELIEFEDTDLFPVNTLPQEVEVATPLRITSTISTDTPVTEDQWRAFQDYVVGKIMELHGPFPRDARKERSIFISFIGRWGFDHAMAIAKAAFEAHSGMWFNSPVKVQRFCKGSDPYFAEPIAALLGLQ